MEPVPVGMSGDLYIAGTGLARGYCNRPALTADRFIPNPFSPKPGDRLYATGDLARFLEDGNIEYLGRTDDQVKIRGNRVEPGEIDSLLRRLPGIRELVVTARQDEGRDKQLIAYIVPDSRSVLTVKDLRAYLQRKLPDYMIPSHFITLEELPRGANGKLDFRALPAPNTVTADAVTIGDDTFDDTERKVCALWEELLKVRVNNGSQTFFELGGHSLLLTKLGIRIGEVFGVAVPLTVLFDAITIHEMADAITKLQLSDVSDTSILNLL
jgi:acyl carrier protein